MAHALNQPLGLILHNAHAAQLLLDSNNATPEMLQIRDIRTTTRAAQIAQRHLTAMERTDAQPTNIHQVVRAISRCLRVARWNARCISMRR